MNPETAALIIKLLELGAQAVVRVRDILDREKRGQPLSDTELAALKTESDAAHVLIQHWTPSPP